jgi:hypothetical protein
MPERRSSVDLVDRLSAQDRGQETAEKASYDLLMLPTKEDEAEEIKESGGSLP